MALLTLVRPSFYQDSVALLALARELRARPDVAEAAALMGTPANRELLAQAGLLTAEAAAAGPRRPRRRDRRGARRGLYRRVRGPRSSSPPSARGERTAAATRPAPSAARCAGCPTPTSP